MKDVNGINKSISIINVQYKTRKINCYFFSNAQSRD